MRESPGLGRRITALFRPYGAQLAAIALIILITSAASIVSALLVRQVFDKALFPPGGGGVDMHKLVPLAIALAVIPLVSGVLSVTQTYLTNVVGNRVMRDLRDRLYAHLQELSLSFFTGSRTGEVQSRLQNDVGGVQTTITTTASSVLSNVVVVVSSVIAMALLSIPLTLLSLVVVPIFVVISRRVGRRRRSARREAQVSLAEMSAITQETLTVSGVTLAKIFGRQEREIGRYAEENRRQVEVQVRQAMVGRTFFALTQAFFGLAPALVYLVAGLELSNGSATITAGTLVAFTALQTRLLMPINQLLQVSVDVSSSIALFQRVFEYLDLDPSIVDKPDATVLEPETVRGRVEFDDVWFAYGGSEREPGPENPPWALRDLSLDVEPGTARRARRPERRRQDDDLRARPAPLRRDRRRGADRRPRRARRDARLAGRRLRRRHPGELPVPRHRAREPALRPARRERRASVVAAARAAFIHDRIEALDGGYDAIVGERGYRFSGGERQRLAIARVLLKDPRVLILDEATSALDTESERIVQRALDVLMRDRTVDRRSPTACRRSAPPT